MRILTEETEEEDGHVEGRRWHSARRFDVLPRRHRKKKPSPHRVPGRAKVTGQGDGRVTMPTGLTDVTVAVSEAKKVREGGEGLLCKCVCVVAGG